MVRGLSLVDMSCSLRTPFSRVARYEYQRDSGAGSTRFLMFHGLTAAWIPFFDDMNAIIFLAPISCFDQVLAEDPNVNRLVGVLVPCLYSPVDGLVFSAQADSVQLWTSIVSNKLLADTPIVLFLNKCDLLRAKIEAGSRFAKHIISYGERPNTFEGCSNCEWRSDWCVRPGETSTHTLGQDLRKKFAGVHKEKSPKPRPFYCHFTSVTVSFPVFISPCTLKRFLARSQDSTTAEILKHGEFSSESTPSSGIFETRRHD